MQDIKSFEDACAKKGISTDLPDVSTWPPAERRSLIAYYKLTVIHDAIVGDWTANWDNYNQYKWYPWFWMNKPGFRFFVSYYDGVLTLSTGGSRLWYPTCEMADYVGKTFTGLYEVWLVVPSEKAFR